MGEVYKARDTRLDRTVAIKILPSADPDRRARFAREAKAIAALSHPHICVLHDVGVQDLSSDPARSVDFIVMEYLEGETLADRLRAGPLAPDALLDLSLQIVGALEAAHAADVVHRDLKPHNIIVTARGQAKVLDFGLAKRIAAAPGDAEASIEETRAAEGLTNPGTAMGTVAYMAPEQARGEGTDARSDIFSFGAVLYEMATGQPAFPGRTTAVIVDGVLNRTPAAARSINPDCPAALEAVIARALEKDPALRYQRASEVRADLERIRSGVNAATPTPPSAVRADKSRRRLLIGAAVVIPIVVVALIGGRRWIWPAADAGQIDSIAVLPFVNGSGTSDADYLSDGIAETLTNSLTKVRGLRVVPRTLAAKYKGGSVDPHDAGVALNARAVVTGRVMQRGDRLTVQAELIDVAGIAQLWGDQFDRPLVDVLVIQADISKAIADGLRLHLSREDERKLTADAPADAVAYQLYLKGRHETDRRTPEGYANATSLFEQAIARDPSYARAYAGLADVSLWQSYWGYLPAAEGYGKALTAANKAVALNEGSADGHATLGWLRLFVERDWAASAREYQRALALDPSSARTHAWYGESLSTRGRHDEAIAELRTAVALDPGAADFVVNLGFVLTNARRYAEALDVLKKAVDQGSDSTLALLDLVRVYRFTGKFDLAIALSQQMADNGDPLGPAFVALSYAHAGRKREALAIAPTLEADARRTHQRSVLVAALYASLGDIDRAFRWLEHAFEGRETFLVWLKVDPELDPLRGDPRFDALIRRIGIPE
jgi:TolB-like protein/Tfp pilus assembly protein PilF